MNNLKNNAKLVVSKLLEKIKKYIYKFIFSKLLEKINLSIKYMIKNSDNYIISQFDRIINSKLNDDEKCQCLSNIYKFNKTCNFDWFYIFLKVYPNTYNNNTVRIWLLNNIYNDLDPISKNVLEKIIRVKKND